MRLYWEVARRAFRRQAAYRLATFAGLFTNTVFAFIKAYVLLAVFAHRADVRGFDAIDAVTFVFVDQGFLMLVSAFEPTTEVAARVRTGDVVTDLYRPVDFQAYWLAMDLGRAFFQALARGIPPVLAGALVFDLRLPMHGATWAVFLVSILFAVLVSFGVRFLISLWTFWLLDDRGAQNLTSVLVLFFSGTMLPIVFFPDWLYLVARVLPFSAMIQLPIEVFLEKYQGWGLVAALGSQLAWVIVLFAAGRLLLAAATRKVVVQGG